MEVYQILIVDDEPFITESIAQMLQENSSLSLDIYRAHSSLTALKIMEQTRIDILVCDISMPGVSGLQLANIVKQHWPLCSIMILTAYANFEYAREAVNLGICQYVLKTDTDKQIVDAFHDCVENYDRKISQNCALSGDGEAPALRKNDILRRNALQTLLNRYDSESEEILNALGLRRDWPIRIVIGSVRQTENAEEAAAVMIRSMERFSTFKGCLQVGALLKDHVVWLWQIAPGDDTEDFSYWLINLYEMMEQHMFSSADLSGNYYVGASSCMVDFLHQNYAHMCGGIVRDALPKKGMVQLFSEQTSGGSGETCQIIGHIHDYVRRHIFENFLMSDIARELGYNASYLSRLYRSNTGKTLSEYISSEKLKQIREIMTDPGLSLQRIAEMAGFESQSTFNRFVRRLTGKSPGYIRAEILQQSVPTDASDSLR